MLFLISAYSRYFLAEDALDEQGKLKREKQKSINKIGHGKDPPKLLLADLNAFSRPTKLYTNSIQYFGKRH